MLFIDKIKGFFTEKKNAFSILETYETQVAILRQEFLDNLDDRYQALFDEEEKLTAQIEALSDKRMKVNKEKFSIQNMTTDLED